MNNKEKINYLSQYMRTKRKYERIDQQLKGVQSIDLNKVKSTVHKSLAERIHERDQVYQEMMMYYVDIDNLVGDDIVLGYLFILCYPLEDIAKKLNTSKNKIRERLYKSLDQLEIH